MGLGGKVALVTGAGRGIGRACALRLAGDGAKVVAAGRQPGPLLQTVQQITARGGQGKAIPADVSSSKDVARLFVELERSFGRLDIVVNNAGVHLVADVERTTEQDWDRVLGVNLKGTYLVSRAAIPLLRRSGGGSLINLGSILSIVGMKERAAYCASKGGVHLLSKAMALDLAPDNIRVNCVCPGAVLTEMMEGILGAAPDPTVALQSRLAQIPLGRMGSPEEVAALVGYLASDEAAWLTGAAIPLDGGVTAY